MALTFALIAPLQPISRRVYGRNETFTIAPEHYETLQNMSLLSYGVDRCSHSEKLRSDFVAQTLALIVPVQLVLH